MSENKEIGGYFGLELDKTSEYHPNAISLNSGRNCFKYILLAKKPKAVYLPYYIDKGMTEESLQSYTKLKFYHINRRLEIDSPISLTASEMLLYVNYYSLKDKYIERLAAKYGNKLIIDNTQSFYSLPLKNIDTIYSTDSKYFGVQSGGYLYTDKRLDDNFPNDYSYERVKHLLGRLDDCAANFYEFYKDTMKARYNQDIKLMSKLSKRILSSINYEKVKILRERNFYYIHSFLKSVNQLKFYDRDVNGPFTYPLLIKNGEKVREFLIRNKVYIPTYWKYILDLKGPSVWERYLVRNLLPLPIDQRYGIQDMKQIVNLLEKVIYF